MHRRDLLRMAGFCAASPVLAARSPTGPELKMWVPEEEESANGVAARALANALVATGQAPAVKLVHVPGSGGMACINRFLSEHRADPNALMFAGQDLIGTSLLQGQPDAFKQLQPVARVASELLVLVARPDDDVDSLAEFVRKERDQARDYPIGIGASGGTEHLFFAMVLQVARAKPSDASFRPFATSAAALESLANGGVSVVVRGYGELEEAILARQVRPLAVSSERASFGIPSFQEQRISVNQRPWRGVFCAPGVAAAQLAGIGRALSQALEDPAWKAVLNRLRWSSVSRFGRSFADVIEVDKSSSSLLAYLLRMKRS